MGFSDIFSDFYNSIGFAELHAEAPPEEDKEDDEGADDAGEEKSDDGEKEGGGEEGGEEEGGDDEGGDDEEEEEEEEEAEDIKPKLEERESMVFLAYLYTSYNLLLSHGIQMFLLGVPISSKTPNQFPTDPLPPQSSPQPTTNNPSSLECAKSAQCAPAKHHYDECAERVTRQHENPDHKGPKEDCVEECEFVALYPWPLHRNEILMKSHLVFHLQHCATQCAAPKLFRQLK